MAAIKNLHLVLTKEYLLKCYDLDMKLIEIAEEVKCSREAVGMYMKKHGIVSRSRIPNNKGRIFSEEHKANLSLAAKQEKNWRYNGGNGMRGGYKTKRINDDYVLVHRLTIEKEIGRKLESWEYVHHKDFDKLNNDIDNLQVMSASSHTTLHNLHNITTDPRKKYWGINKNKENL